PCGKKPSRSCPFGRSGGHDHYLFGRTCLGRRRDREGLPVHTRVAEPFSRNLVSENLIGEKYLQTKSDVIRHSKEHRDGLGGRWESSTCETQTGRARLIARTFRKLGKFPRWAMSWRVLLRHAVH